MATCPECGSTFPYKAAPPGEPRKKVPCPECENVVVPIVEKPKPVEVAAKKKPAAKPAPAPSPPPPPPKTDPFGDDDNEVLGFADNTDLAEERKKREEDEAKAKKTKPKQKKAEIQVKIRNIGDLDRWTLVSRGLVLIQSGAMCWGVAMLLQALALILSIVGGPEYNNIALEFLYNQDPNLVLDVGQREPVRLFRFLLAYIYGPDFWRVCHVLLIIGQVLYLIQFGLWMTAYFLFLRGCPERYGAKLQSIILMSVSSVHFLLNLFLVTLPLFQAYDFVICPLLGPEMALGSYGTSRRFPLHIQWTDYPIVDAMLTLLVLTLRYLEPMVIGAYIWTIGLNIREEDVENKGMTIMNMSVGVMFVMLCYHLGADCGTSPVLVGILRFVYLLWFLFTAGIVIVIASGCHKTREVLKKYFTGEVE